MRLWHQSLIPYLDRQRLLGQHRECCALRGNGWGRKHTTVNYVFKYSPAALYNYHTLVMDEMERRGYNVDDKWRDPHYRGKNCKPWDKLNWYNKTNFCGQLIYNEHDHSYLIECLENLHQKGVEIDYF